MINRLAGILLSVSVFFLVACGGGEEPERDLTKPVSVKTIVAKVQPVSSQTSYSGTVIPVEQVRLSTKIMGWVEKINFAEGEWFKKGDTLVKLRSKDLEAKRAQAEAGIAAATVHFQNMETNLKRIESLFAKKAATQKELDDMHSAYAAAKAQKITAEKMKVEVDEILKYSNISAPFDGVVGRKMVQVGDMANPGQPILQIENPTKMKIVAKVPESDVDALRVDMPVFVTVGASKAGTGGTQLQGTIDKIVPSGDPMSRQFDIQVLMDNRDGKMKSGMFARISIRQDDSASLLIPHNAIMRRGQLVGAYVVNAENRAILRWIRTGNDYGGQTEVLAGINPGDRIVVEGKSQLMDGQSVEVSQ